MSIPYGALRPLCLQFPGSSLTLDRLEEQHRAGALPGPVTEQNLFTICDELDEAVGLHWPIIATNLWRPLSQPILTAYFATAQDLETGLAALLRSGSLLFAIFEVQFQTTPTGMIVKPRAPSDATERHSEILAILVALMFHAICKDLRVQDAPKIATHFGFGRRPFHSVLENLLNGPAHYGEDAPCCHIPTSALAHKMPTADADANTMLLRALQKRAEPIDSAPLTKALIALIGETSDFSMTASEFAAQMGMTSRTMQRKLRQENTSYAELRNRVFEAKLRLLIGQNAPTQDIIGALNIPDSAALNALCKRLLGKSLRALRSERIGR